MVQAAQRLEDLIAFAGENASNFQDPFDKTTKLTQTHYVKAQFSGDCCAKPLS